MRFSGYIAHMRITRNTDTILDEESEENSPLGRHKRKWKYNIKMYVKK
jgi:hypothetical protein